ncbi:MAG: isoprenylcysteine carboxylmethyltransferase family protein [Flavobacteriaceae bacterium]|nr:isoprenylcysteine carboxylmethyltransferase family protein [Flavobacteriaceae bacterium]
MKLKIPPALQVAIFAILMWVIKKLTVITHFEFEQQRTISWIIFVIGILIGIIAIYAFRKARTTADPLHPAKASKLVIVSIYKISRNPMYLGMFFILLAFAVRLGSFFTFPILILYVWYITTFQIKPEEKVLTKLFEEDYSIYCKKVRRWI